MELTAHYLQEKLLWDVEAEHVEVEDTTLEQGKPLLQRHQLVNECLEEDLQRIHAFEQKTLTPQQWSRQCQK
ncbi:bolA-like protein 2 [Thomomys bottae]